MNRRVAIGAALVTVAGAGAAGGAKLLADQKSDGGLKKTDGKFVVGQQVYPTLVFSLWSTPGEGGESLGEVYFGDHIEILAGPFLNDEDYVVYEVRIDGTRVGYTYERFLSGHRI